MYLIHTNEVGYRFIKCFEDTLGNSSVSAMLDCIGTAVVVLVCAFVLDLS